MNKLSIIKFIEPICNVLKIERPYVEVTAEELGTPTTLAAFDPSSNRLYIKDDAQDLDLFFAMAHELRHAWQLKYNKNFYLDNYKRSNEIPLEEYNLQKAEIDANAFAMLTVEALTDATPLFQGLSKRVIKEIDKRADEILEDLIKFKT